jgi:uncharacterized protein (DUF2267 family)
MQYHEFVGQVQNRARLGTTGEAVRAINATLETLGERIDEGEARHLAAQLPQEIGKYLEQAKTTESFELDEFFERVATRETVDLPDSVHHARVVVDVLLEAVTPDQVDHLRAQLPGEYEELLSAGSEGEM